MGSMGAQVSTIAVLSSLLQGLCILLTSAVTHLLMRLGSAAVSDPRVATLLFPLLQHATNLGVPAVFAHAAWQRTLPPVLSHTVCCHCQLCHSSA